MQTSSIDQSKLEIFATRAVADATAGYTGVLVSIGHKLGLYRAMAGYGPSSVKEIAVRSRCAERYVREWLNAQAAGGYLLYHAAGDSYELPDEHALVLADEESPYFIPTVWNVPAAMWADEAKAIKAFRSGEGVAWGEHDGRMACGIAAFYRNAYKDSLVSVWLPALDGVVRRLEEGINVADIGCGHGHATLLMAEAFPKSRFWGFDTHAASIEEARSLARSKNVDDRVTFELATASTFPQHEYGLICFFDTLHDLGDPVGAAARARQALGEGGTVMLVEPFAKDRIEDNLSAVSQLYYSGSTLICCAHAISEGGKYVLGAQAGPARLEGVFRKAGFKSFRKAMDSPFNMVLEVKQ